MRQQLLKKYWRDQQGMALVLAIIMIPIIAFLGLLAMNSTTSDNLRSSRVFAEQQAFYAAERAVEYSANRELLLSMDGSEDLMVDTESGGDKHYVKIDAGQTAASGGGELTSGTVVDEGPGVLPVRLAGLYGSEFGANYYDISVKTQGPMQTQARVETQVVRLYKRDDDSVFITTGSEK